MTEGTCETCLNFREVKDELNLGYCKAKKKLVPRFETRCDEFDERVYLSMSEFWSQDEKFDGG